MNRENLQRLIDYAKTLPENYEIHMGAYRTHKETSTQQNAWDFVPSSLQMDCGTVACFVGLGPLANITPREEETWSQYIHRCFAPDEKEFSWVFGGAWSNTDNTLKGAIARAEWFLAHGIPDDASMQRLGEAPLCYVVQP